jgi:hypothetical protein
MSPPAVEIEVMKKSSISFEILILVLTANNIKKNGFCQTRRRQSAKGAKGVRSQHSTIVSVASDLLIVET